MRLLDVDDWVYLSRLDPPCDSYAILVGAELVERNGSDVTHDDIVQLLRTWPSAYLHSTDYRCVDRDGGETELHPYG